MVVIGEEHMSWLLFQNLDEMYLSVVCGTVGIFTVDIQLTQSEVLGYKSAGNSYIEQLASSVRGKPEFFRSRQEPNFRTKFNITQALSEWRNSL